MKAKIAVLLICSFILLLSGCWSMNEAERMLYMHGIGIDYQDDQYVVYAQIIDFAKIAKSEEAKSEPEQSEVGYATGKTMEEAVFNLYKTVDEKIYWGHLSFIVFSEEALKKGKMDAVIDGFIRFIETRYQVWVYSTKDKVKDVLLTVPIINTAINLSRLSNPLNSYEQASYIEPTDLRNLIIGLNEPSHEMVIPSISVVQNWETVTRQTKIAKLSGVGVVSPKEFKGFIEEDKANGLQWMNNRSKRGEISFRLNKEDENSYIAVILFKVKVNVKPIIKKDTVQFDIDVSMDGTVNSVPEHVKSEVIQKRIEQDVKKEIKKTYKEALEKDIDIYRLSEYVYRKDNKAWKKFEKDGKIELTEDSIRTLNVTVRKIKSGRKSLSKPFSK
ncbi:Ger(x)C family spore germination protein [Pseudogracilibacillus auburnensis]|uniref:Ger(X)C family germination protein n=1 Tax=Pseudogracilibacillus auburnensis TaxID=1494959 RepID=A0A2V3VVU8_9BACI|nr:Ger(x)C family spore germination protein [Pseudogracilibacillus auburnensis]MBO1004031.1 Ger(x)C family spore germination protein [Pseudogracilibacillus auburnensis]PXW85680.1 Ger(x)C family germination protein [Pseudogracilibacillus auburnensis]